MSQNIAIPNPTADTLRQTFRGMLATIYGGELGMSGLVILPVALAIGVAAAAVIVTKGKKSWLFALPTGLALGVGITAAYARVISSRAKARHAEIEAQNAANTDTARDSLTTATEGVLTPLAVGPRANPQP